MFATQRIFCIARMIEHDHLPIFISVATFTFRAKMTFVFVVFFMAGNARGRRTFELGIVVAVLASHISMFTC